MSIRMRLKTLDALSMLPGISNLRRRTLARLSGGVPRVVNVLCDRALE
jgi:hypothetical protein